MTYIEKALRTESIEGAENRLQNVFTQLGSLNEALEYLVEKKADDIKKYIYYGKKANHVDIYEGKISDSLHHDVTDTQLRLLHSGLGMLTEAQEFLKPILDGILTDKDIDLVNLKEELGDMMWYAAIACDSLDTTFEEEQDRNIAKLTLRYPEKFTEDKAINRDTDAERKVLEND